MEYRHVNLHNKFRHYRIFVLPVEAMVEILARADIQVDPEAAARRLWVADRGLLRWLIDASQAASGPMDAFRASCVDEKREDGVVLDGVSFKERS
jgi:hypothetical protein